MLVVLEKANALISVLHTQMSYLFSAKYRLDEFTNDISIANKLADEVGDRSICINTKLEPAMTIELHENFLRVDSIEDLLRLKRYYTNIFYLYTFADFEKLKIVPFPDENLSDLPIHEAYAPPFKNPQYALNYFAYEHASWELTGSFLPVKFQNLIDEEINQRTNGVNTLTESRIDSKLKWKSGPSQFGFILDLLIQGGYIEKPASSYPKCINILLQHFEIDAIPSTLAKEMSEKTNSLSKDNRNKIIIPHKDKLL